MPAKATKGWGPRGAGVLEMEVSERCILSYHIHSIVIPTYSHLT